MFGCDVSDDPGVKRMLVAVEATFGRLDALVNNAGITSTVAPKDFDAMTAEEWDRVFAVNVRGMFQVTRAAVPMLRAARGSIVNTASIVGLRPGPQPLPVCRQQSGGREPDQVAGDQSGAGDSRQRRRARLDGRRLDAAHARPTATTI